MEQLSIDLVRGSGDLGQRGLILLALSFILISLSFLPRSPACIVAGLVYGISAFPVVLVASTLGALIGLLISRYLFQQRFRQVIDRHPRWRHILHAVDAQGWILVVLLRLASPIPGSVTDYLLGLTRIRLWPYVAITFFGIAPQTFLFVFIGAVGPAAVQSGPLSVARFAFVLAGLVTSAVIVWLIARHARASLSSRLEIVPIEE
jgi:uncharacterized membrane protein YdjX (TVP38/TMEM64 family)